METVKREELKGMLDRNDAYYLINVLAPGEFEKAHIPGSYNIPVADRNFIEKAERRIGDKDAKIIVYCADFACSASPNAVKRLADAGFTHVVNFEGGVQDWREAGYPLQSGGERREID
jgi:rhodanese-related sulfurtransferase